MKIVEVSYSINRSVYPVWNKSTDQPHGDFGNRTDVPMQPCIAEFTFSCGCKVVWPGAWCQPEHQQGDARGVHGATYFLLENRKDGVWFIDGSSPWTPTACCNAGLGGDATAPCEWPEQLHGVFPVTGFPLGTHGLLTPTSFFPADGTNDTNIVFKDKK